MSIWSHVNASFRVDYIQYDKPIWNENELDKIRKSCMNYENFSKIILERGFGKVVTFEDLWNNNISRSYISEHPDEFLPMGSEGSLNMSIWINPNTSSMANYTVNIFGDLRDHTDINGLIDWFKDKCRIFGIRNATIEINNELYGIKTCTYIDGENWLESDWSK